MPRTEHRLMLCLVHTKGVALSHPGALAMTAAPASSAV